MGAEEILGIHIGVICVRTRRSRWSSRLAKNRRSGCRAFN